MTIETPLTAETARTEFKRHLDAREWDAARGVCARMLVQAGDRRERFRWLLNSINTDYGQRRLTSALSALLNIAHLLDESGSDLLRGNYHGSLALVCEALGMNDRAAEEYAGAAYHHERVGSEDLAARDENNLAVLFIKMGLFEEAAQKADSARARFVTLGNYAAASAAARTQAEAYEALAVTGRPEAKTF